MTGAIHDAASIAASMETRPADPRAYLLAFYPDAPIPPLDHIVLTAAPLIARVNHGIWIASCDCGAPGFPRPGCVVWLDMPFGFCVRCLNRAWGGGWRRVVVLPADERRAIETILDFRAREHQNWEPYESIDDLIRQNIEAGDPISEAS